MQTALLRAILLFLPFAAYLGTDAAIPERRARFDRDPGWEGRNNRAQTPGPRLIQQDFGFSRTAHAGRNRGEAGGFITPAAEAAYYAKRIPVKRFTEPISASGTLTCIGRQFHVLIGFFNADTLNEWRTPNTIALRLLGRGDRFYAYVEYATGKWRAGGDSPGGFSRVRDPETGREQLRGFATGAVHSWTLKYDPLGNQGGGSVTVTIDNETAVCHLDPGHKADGAAFNRFGLLNVLKHADDGGEVWMDDVTILGETERFDREPDWEGRRNRARYSSFNVRPRFDFGYSATRYAGGQTMGELGGLVFRGDNRHPERMACYGDRLHPLSLQKPLRARGRICLRRGVSDSTTLLGFYHSVDSMASSASQADALPRRFLGIAIEGPSSEGFLLRPAYRLSEGGSATSPSSASPRIYPDGTAHEWTLEYFPDAASGNGRIVVTLDRQVVSLELQPGERAGDPRFDRFGIVTTWIDGNGQQIYFDDLAYTGQQRN